MRDWKYQNDRKTLLAKWEKEGKSRTYTGLDEDAGKALILKARSQGLTAAHVVASWVPKMGLKWEDFKSSNPNCVSKFLNRILGLPLERQNVLFEMFESLVTDVMKQAIERGDFDRGIATMKGGLIDFHSTPPRSFKMGGQAHPNDIVSLHTVERDAGISLPALQERTAKYKEEVQKSLEGLEDLAKQGEKDRCDDIEGFWVSRTKRKWDAKDNDRFKTGSKCPPKFYYILPEKKRGVTRTVRRLNPATGEDSFPLSNFEDDFIRIRNTCYDEKTAELWWAEEYKASNVKGNTGIGANIVTETGQAAWHRYWGNRRSRNRTEYILTGDLCPILADVHNKHAELVNLSVGVSKYWQVIRVEAPKVEKVKEEVIDMTVDEEETPTSSQAELATVKEEENLSVTAIKEMIESGEIGKGMLVACEIPGVGIFRGEVDTIDLAKGKATVLVCGERKKLKFDKLAGARHRFISEGKVLLHCGFEMNAASSISVSLDTAIKARPVSVNDGKAVAVDGAKAHENFEIKDPEACGVDVKPEELVGYKYESRMVTHPSMKKKGEEEEDGTTQQMEQVDAILSHAAAYFHGIGRSSLVNIPQDMDEAPPSNKRAKER